jgi:hypothetical protein
VEDHQVEWVTPDGDGIMLAEFQGEAEFLKHAQTVDDIRKFCGQALYGRHDMAEPFVWLFELSFPTVAGRRCLWTAAKWRLQPSGMLYEGILTLPFHQRTFEISLLCPEAGVTGVREVALMIEARGSGNVRENTDGSLPGDWNPDLEEFDHRFPDHPVSRLRRGMNHIKTTLRLHESLAQADRFFFPPEGA